MAKFSRSVIITTLFVCASFVRSGAVRCNLPSLNQNIESKYGEGSEALIQENCPGLPDDTRSWGKGLQVMSDCTSVPIAAGIATFEGLGGTKYHGGKFKHAAIFIGRCNKHGFHVFDQDVNNDGKSHGVKHRFLKYSGTGSDGGSNYYVIEPS